MRGASKTFVFVVFLHLLSPIILSSSESGYKIGDDQVIRREKSEKEDDAQREATLGLAERAIGIADFMNRWTSLKTWAKLAWINLIPPDSGYGISGSSRGIKEAASKSFETSKETVEHAAEAVLGVAEQAVHQAKDKVKRSVNTVPERSDPDAEL